MCDDGYKDMVERLAEEFTEIQSDVLKDLKENNEEYRALRDKLQELKHQRSEVCKLLEFSDNARLTEEDYPILMQAFKVWFSMDELERQHIYFRGHADALAYLKKMGAL